MTANEEMAPQISVLMPVYDAEPYLAFALDSLLEQTFQDFEIIALNDGSTDLSGQILTEYRDRDWRIRVFHRPQRGLVATLNEGVDLARGEWIARMDADDIALPQRFKLQLDHLSRTGADFCGGAVECFGNSSAVWRYPKSNAGCGVHLLFGVPVAHPAVMGRTAVFRCMRYRPSFRHAEDYDLWQRAWASGYHFINLDDIVLRYRVHQKQVSFKHTIDQGKKADEIRMRHWHHVCPTLESDWFKIKISKFSRGEGNAAHLMEGMLKVLCCIPENTHCVFLRGCLGIFARGAWRDPRSMVFWIRLCRSAKENSWRITLYGVVMLAIRFIIRFNPEGSIYAFLRTIRYKLTQR